MARKEDNLVRREEGDIYTPRTEVSGETNMAHFQPPVP